MLLKPKLSQTEQVERAQERRQIILKLIMEGLAISEMSKKTGFPETSIRRYIVNLKRDPSNGVLDIHKATLSKQVKDSSIHTSSPKIDCGGRSNSQEGFTSFNQDGSGSTILRKKKVEVVAPVVGDDGLRSRIELLTEGTKFGARNSLLNMASNNQENAITVCGYMTSYIFEVNPSIGMIATIILTLGSFSRFFKHKKNFKEMTKDDLLLYLNSFRKTEQASPKHGWISTYNKRISYIGAFFRWLYYPDLERKKRPKPPIIQNVPWLKRKEVSVYDPGDLWVEEENALFLKYCPSTPGSKRNKCYHMMELDTQARPHELLRLKMKDISFELSPTGIQYALVNIRSSKTTHRVLPLIKSIPYVKDWWDNHPLGHNPENIFLCGLEKVLGKVLGTSAMGAHYTHYKTKFFPKLLVDPNIPEEDKAVLRKLLNKPWNPYILRHSGLTSRSMQITESALRQHAGWSKTSNMPNVYLHHFGHESSNEVLKAEGIILKDKQNMSILKPKQCPGCGVINKPEAKFCIGCRTVLSYDGFNEMIKKETERQEDQKKLEEQMRIMQESQNAIIKGLGATSNIAANPRQVIQPYYTVESDTPPLEYKDVDKEERKRRLMVEFKRKMAEVDQE
jgi:integrase